MFSTFGRKVAARSGILELMDDLGHALTVEPDMLMLGGGNPAAIPEMQTLWRERMSELLQEDATFDRMLGNYDPPRGNPRFLRALAGLLERELGWAIGPENLAVTNGSQSAFFFLFNLLAGEYANGRHRKILLPLAPEYIGYADQGIDEGIFVSCRPNIEWPLTPAARVFKYRVDFAAVEDALENHDIAAIAVSRPTNPTGNVLTDEEMTRLSQLARLHNIPLLIDNAYGAPFPGVIFTDAKPFWDENTILTLSLSKLGLPGTRTAVVVGPPEVAGAVAAMTAVIGLANGNIGQRLVQPYLEDGRLLEIGRTVLRPFYRERNRQAQKWVHQFFGAKNLAYGLHVSEGAFFHWLWFRRLKVTTRELYERLKQRRVLVVPGEYFFFGLLEEWDHRHECIRLNFSGPPEVVREGLRIIADEAEAVSE
ncbi:MAG: valine--pyruvate transaminase [Verrucomicrobiales bacterium]